MWQKIRDYFKEHSRVEKKKLKEMTLKEKIEYIWEYYKIHIISAVIVIFIAGSIINGILNPPVPAYAGVAFYETYLGEDFEAEFTATLNGALVEDTSIETVYAHFLLSGGDPSVEMALSQKLMAMLVSHELDVIVIETEMIERFIYDGMLMPLSEAGLSLPDDILIYGESSEVPGEFAYAANLTNSALFKDFGIKGEMLCAGVVGNSQRVENAAAVMGLMFAE